MRLFRQKRGRKSAATIKKARTLRQVGTGAAFEMDTQQHLETHSIENRVYSSIFK